MNKMKIVLKWPLKNNNEIITMKIKKSIAIHINNTKKVSQFFFLNS